MMTNGSYLAWRESPSATLETLGAWSVRRPVLAEPASSRQLLVAGVTAGLLDMVGGKPLLGRTFIPADERDIRVVPAAPGSADASGLVMIIAYGLWQQQFGGRADILGQSLRLDGSQYTVIGVMPASFVFPDRETRAWVPWIIRPMTTPGQQVQSIQMFQALGKMRDGISPEQVSAEGTARGRSVSTAGPVTMAVFGSRGAVEITALPLLEALTREVRPAILIMLAAVVLLLVTATANAASLQLARASARRRELAARLAQRPDPGARRGFAGAGRRRPPIADGARARADHDRAISDRLRAARRRRAHRAQLRGDDARRPWLRPGQRAGRARLAATPGVLRVAPASSIPFTSGESLSSFPVTKRDGTATQGQTGSRDVSPGYFAALGQRVIEGREFTPQDDAGAQEVVIVNREFSRKYLDGRAHGWTLPGADDKPPRPIVGVVEDTARHNVGDAPQPEVYYPMSQRTAYASDINFVLRTADDPRSLVPAVRTILRDAAPRAPLESIMTMEDRIATSLSRPRLYAVLLGTFALFALAIAGVGLFGVLSYAVALRAREIGVRTALGAQMRDIVTLVVGQSVAIAIGGVAIGLIASFWLTGALQKFLFGVTPRDAVSFAGVAVLLLVVAVVASTVPARRAARVDPVKVLRA